MSIARRDFKLRNSELRRIANSQFACRVPIWIESFKEIVPMKSPTVAAALTLFAASLFAPLAVACEMHSKVTSASAATVDPIKTASMEMTAPVTTGDITVEGYWIKAMLPGQPVAGGYLSIANTGQTDDKLIKASSAKSGRVELHEMTMNDDVMKMRQVEDGIAVPAGANIELAPGGLHLMFFDVGDSFKEGDMVPVSLTFEKAGTVELMLPVMNKGMSH
jgi:periplasmic copper chaperone A